MDKSIFYFSLALCLFTACQPGAAPEARKQSKASNEKAALIAQADSIPYAIAMDSIRRIFEDYKTNEEGIESEDNKHTMTHCLQSLYTVSDSLDLRLLIDIWNYYDPTDYYCKSDIYTILMRDKARSIVALKDRIQNRMSWEAEDLSGTDFKTLLQALEKE